MRRWSSSWEPENSSAGLEQTDRRGFLAAGYRWLRRPGGWCRVPPVGALVWVETRPARPRTHKRSAGPRGPSTTRQPEDTSRDGGLTATVGLHPTAHYRNPAFAGQYVSQVKGVLQWFGLAPSAKP